MKLLHIDASITGDASVSRRLSAAVVDRLRRENPRLSLVYRDLAARPLPHLDGAQFAALKDDAPATPDKASNRQVLQEFLEADTVVIGAPMYNFGVPSQLKAWIDRILVAGQTFSYSEAGPKGLAGGKRVIIAIARGGLYGPGAPAQPAEHLETYLRVIFGFIGVTAPEIIIAEGLLLGPDQRDAAVAAALAEAAAPKAA